MFQKLFKWKQACAVHATAYNFNFMEANGVFLFFARPFMNMLLYPLSNSTCCASDGDVCNGMSTLGDYGNGEGRGPTGRPVCVYFPNSQLRPWLSHSDESGLLLTLEYRK